MPTSSTEERPPETDALPVDEARPPEKGTHVQILKSSALVGGSQAVNIVIGMVRTKAMAVLLGPAGFGLFGLFNSVANLAQTLAGLGINGSGVRQIAAAVSTGDALRIAQTVRILRRVSVLLGLLGAGGMILFSRQIATVTFGNDRHERDICWLAISVFLMLVSASQAALIQGMRRIADLAKMQILGAVFGTVCGIPLVYFYGERGVVPSLICVAAMAIVTSWWYSRKIQVSASATNPASMPVKQMLHEVSALLKLGVAFMASSLITLGVAYLIRITLVHRVGLVATGLYQSAWTLGGLYVAFILQAMAADFYPRLTASAHDDVACNRLVNEQAHVGILLATPGVIASLTFAPLVVALFYSAKFGPAVGILRWICVGAMLQVITWPMGYIIIAKAKRGLFVACEVAWGIVSVALAWFCIARFGLTGAGTAFFLSYIFHGVMIYSVVSRVSGFRWSKENWTSGALALAMVTLVFGGFFVLPLFYGVALGSLAVILSAIYSLRSLMSFLAPKDLPRPLRKLLVLCGLVSKTGNAWS